MDENPNDDNIVGETWETGLRRRRGGERGRRASGEMMPSSAGDDDDGDGDDGIDSAGTATPSDDDVVDVVRPPRAGGASISGLGGSGGLGGIFPPGSARPAANVARLGSLVGDGAAAVVGVLAGPLVAGLGMSGMGGGAGGGGGTMVAAHGGVGAGGGGGGYSTPYKGPFKGGAEDDGLVETPSSITTAGQTADSTTLASRPPLGVRRLNERRRRGSAPIETMSLRRQYRMLRSQIMLLLGSSALGLLLFLFYALPLAAFASLLFVSASIGALVPVASSMLRAQYELEMEHPLGLVRYLPESIRIMLTETTLHEFMADTAFFMEYRYLLLYFVPGLSPDQLMAYIGRLPARHREALLRPGLGRLVPSVMENLMRIDDDDDRRDDAWRPAGDDGEEGDDGDSSASGLTMDREQRRLGEDDEGEEDGGGGDVAYDDDDGEAPVTLLEAAAGLRRTLVDFARGNAPVAHPAGPTPLLSGRPADAVPRIIADATPPSNDGEDREEDERDGDSFDFSVDLSAHGLTNMLATSRGIDEAPIAPAEATASSGNDFRLGGVIVELPRQSPDSGSNQLLLDDANQQQQQQEYDLEGMILSEAASAATSYYAAQATAAAREAASEGIVATSTWIIRAGSWTGFIAGGGGIMAAILADRRGLYNFGSSAGGGAGGRNGDNASDAISAERRSRYVPAVYGLFATSAFGFVGAGAAYFLRNRVRAAIAAKRDEQALMDVLHKEVNEAAR